MSYCHLICELCYVLLCHIQYTSSSNPHMLYHSILLCSLFRNDYPPAEEATSSEDKGLLVKVITTI